MTAQPFTLDYLLSPRAIREQSAMIAKLARDGKTHFSVHDDQLSAVVDYVVDIIREKYPDLNIPFHSRWGHFRVGSYPRLLEFQRAIAHLPPLERAQAQFDLVISSVLLDAGAGMAWSFHEPQSQETFKRSEGLGVASFWMFMAGAFSHETARPFQVTAQGLKNLTIETLSRGFQVSAHNPIVGLEGRLRLLNQLGAAIENNPQIFPSGRPGGLVPYLVSHSENGRISALKLLRGVLDGLGSIWPGRLMIKGVNLGDCWHHPALGLEHEAHSFVPFHKLSQWLSYSLIEPLVEAGFPVDDVGGLTGLPEYRNGGLILDLGLIQLRDPELAKHMHRPSSPLIIEWRALTIALLDQIADGVRKKIGKSPEEFPLAKVLEGGTWWAGRKIAAKLRSDGGPPLQLESDGTVF